MLAQAQQEAEAAEQLARQREEEHQGAEVDVERAEAALHELEERATELAQQLHATQELRRQVRTDLDNARHRATATGHAAQTAHARAKRLKT
jgi:DNA repair exonuclease SbcCD ATPase subunit